MIQIFWWLFLIIFSAVVIPAILPGKRCSPDTARTLIESLFLEAKEKAIDSGEAKISFLDGKVVIKTQEEETEREVDFSPKIPPVMVRACSNQQGFPSQQTEFIFSSYGLKGISGAIYISCGDDFLAFSVVAPVGGISSCILKNGKWEEF